MCRIAGIISKNRPPGELAHHVKAMANIQRHGGPDDEGFFADESLGLALGHRRLSLIDLSPAGRQPMLADEKKISIVFNGEIYNYQEIKTELQASGIHFENQTDTEVILQAYCFWGTSSFTRLKGMFAFSITDSEKQKTYLVRDPGGIKPLYFAVTDHDLCFASEVKAFQLSGYYFTPNPDWKVFFLAFGHIPEPFTTLEKVQHLPKGHFLEWHHKECSYQVKKFYTYSFTASISTEEEACYLIRKNLDTAVKRHLVADASLGVFLSGGIDSSIITLLASKYQQQKLKTLSINLQETDYAEKRFQQLVVGHTKGHHNEYLVTYKDFVNYFDTIIGAMDQPSNDGINSWFVCKSASDHGLKAVLSGLGGDELFGGYPSFNRMSYLNKIKIYTPSALLKLADRQSDMRYKRLYYLSYEHPVGEYLFLRGFFTPGIISSVLNRAVEEVDAILQKTPVPEELNALSKGNRASWFETNLYMQNQLLRDTDYMSMSHGLEVRVPFLDPDFMNTALSIDPAVKFNASLPKHLLIKAFEDILPRPIWDRKKMGFSFPFEEWMRRFDRISEPAHYSNKTSNKLMKDFKQGKLHWSHAFALYHVSQ